MSIAATVTVLIPVFILGAFIPSFLYVQSSVDSQKERVDIRAYVSDTAKVAQVNQLQDQLKDLQAQGLIREFTYNGVAFVDPGPSFSPEDVRDLYSAQYPELTTAAIDGLIR